MTLWMSLALALVLGLTVNVLAEHRPGMGWMKEFMGRDGHSCCAELDCVEATVALLYTTERTAGVMIGDVHIDLPAQWVHPSRGEVGYWCYVATNRPVYVDDHGIKRSVPPDTPTADLTRCVFYHSLN